MRALPVSLALTVVGAFAVGWTLARTGRSDPAAGQGDSVSASSPASGNAKTLTRADGSPNTQPAAQTRTEFPEVFDPQVRAALANPDLAAAVRGFMARQEEDHCADTRLIQLIESLPESRLGEIPALLEAFAKDDYVTKHVLTPWAARQPEAALAWASGRGADTAKLFPSLLTGWTRKDPAAAAAWMETQPLSAHSRDLQTALITTLSESDPARALALLREKGWTTNADAVQRLLNNQASTNPAAALDSLRDLVREFGASDENAPGGLPRSFASMLGAVLSGAAGRPAGELEELLGRLTPGELTAGAEPLAQDALAIRPELTSSIQLRFDGSEKDKAQALLLARADPNRLLAQFSQVSDPALRVEGLRIMTDLTRRGSKATLQVDNDPAVRAAILQTLDGASEGQARVLEQQVAVSFASGSPALAGEVWNRLGDDDRKYVGTLALKGMAATAPEAAMELWKSSSPDVQAAVVRGLTAGLGASRPELGVEIAMGRTDPKLQAESLAATLAAWSERDPPAALAEMLRLLPRVDRTMFETALSSAGSFRSSFVDEHRPIGRGLRDHLKTLPSAP